MALAQLIDNITKIEVAGMRYSLDLVPGQGVVKSIFANTGFIDASRNLYVWYHALVLGRPTRDTIEFGLSDFQLPMIQWPNRLNRTLAEGLRTHHKAAPVVLDGPRKDLGSR